MKSWKKKQPKKLSPKNTQINLNCPCLTCKYLANDVCALDAMDKSILLGSIDCQSYQNGK